jgi:hypothetical protein
MNKNTSPKADTTPNAALETCGILVGDEVKVTRLCLVRCAERPTHVSE